MGKEVYNVCRVPASTREPVASGIGTGAVPEYAPISVLSALEGRRRKVSDRAVVLMQ